MNVLPIDRQVAIIAALTEGVSIRATERLTSVHRDTIMRLGVRVGEGCAELHDRMMTNLQVGRVELDEAWSYVGKKQRKVTPADSNAARKYWPETFDVWLKDCLTQIECTGEIKVQFATTRGKPRDRR
jgi:hypothetical protein